MGGSAKTPKPSNAARNTAKLAEQRAGVDAEAVRGDAERARKARRRSLLEGGPAGSFFSTLGAGAPTLGVNG